MFRNYFKTAWRNLVRNKFYTGINILGLTAGLSVGIMILLWVQDELSYDKFHKNAANLYRLENMVGTGNSRQIWQATAAPIGMMAKKEIPAVKEATRMVDNYFYSLFRYKDKVFEEKNSVFTDAAIFSMFDFPILKGDAKNPLPDASSVVLTETVAKKYFGEEDPIGKIISADGKMSFRVTAVVKDFPKNSSIHAPLFLSMTQFSKLLYEGKPGESLDHDFRQYQYATFLETQPNADLSGLPKQIRDIHLRNKPDDTDITYLLLPVSKMHLYKADGSNGGIETVKMFSMIALVILIIACINYVNLSTARAMLRAREVSLRKIVGAAKWQLFMQFITETAILFMLAAALSLGVIYLLAPAFNQVSGKELEINFSDIHIWEVLLTTILASLVASSIYPALLLSSFEPLKALKGKIATRISDAYFRKILVVVQFTFSVILITGTIVIASQLHYIRSKELGYDKEHIFSFYMRDMRSHFDAAKTSLMSMPGIIDVTRASSDIVEIGGQTGDNDWDGKEKGETMMVRPMAIEKDFIPFFKIKMAEGQNFDGSVSDSTHFILNETAVRTARIKNPIGKKFRLWKTEGTIVGVVKDFHLSSLKNKIEPVVFLSSPPDLVLFYVKTNGKDAPKAIQAAQQQYKQYNADFPFSYAFLDETFNHLYESEERTEQLFNVFSAMAILISCLGLFGLSAYTANMRTREIGVRKVLGAGVPGIVGLLAGNFIRLVFISIVIALPVSWYAMNAWLQDFAYKIDLNWTVFALSGTVAIIIALVTISFQSIKAALANPVTSLRSE